MNVGIFKKFKSKSDLVFYADLNGEHFLCLDQKCKNGNQNLIIRVSRPELIYPDLFFADFEWSYQKKYKFDFLIT